MDSSLLRELPPDLRSRYGYPRRNSGTALLITVAVASLLAALSWVGFRLSQHPVDSKLLAWQTVAVDRTDATFEVHREPTDLVTCVLRIQNLEHVDVGYATVLVPPRPEEQTNYEQVTYSVATAGRGNAVELLGCSNDGPPPVAAANFPPGTENPAQPWRP